MLRIIPTRSNIAGSRKIGVRAHRVLFDVNLLIMKSNLHGGVVSTIFITDYPNAVSKVG